MKGFVKLIIFNNQEWVVNLQAIAYVKPFERNTIVQIFATASASGKAEAITVFQSFAEVEALIKAAQL